mgnify:CR=1 FL=1
MTTTKETKNSSGLIQKAPMNTQALTLPILNMNSPHCPARVEKAINALPTLAASSVDLAAQTVTLADAPSAQTVRDAVRVVREAGYDVSTDNRLFRTSGITCGGCVNSVTKVISALPGVLAVTVDIPLKQATVETVHGTLTDDAIHEALSSTAYEFIAQAA